MDNRSIFLEGIISGEKGYYDCPIEIKLYGTNEPVERQNLIAQLRADRLPVGHAMDRTRKEQKAEKERQKAATQAARQAKKNAGAVVGTGQGVQYENSLAEFAASSSQGTGVASLSIEDILDSSERFNPRNVAHVVEQFGVKEEDLVRILSLFWILHHLMVSEAFCFSTVSCTC